MRTIDLIAIHHSASGLWTTAEHIRDWHIAKGWSDIGYHFVIESDGVVKKGRPVDKIGAHIRFHNTHSIGICLVGNNTDAQEKWTDAQIKSLKNLLTVLGSVYPEAEIKGHRDMAATLCPGLDVAELLAT